MPLQETLHLPFYLHVGHSPCGELTSEVVIGWSPRGDIETQCSIATASKRLNLWCSKQLIPTATGTATAWRQDSSRLAVAQFLSLYVSDLQNTVWLYRFTEPVIDIAYEPFSGGLLVLAGKTLYRFHERSEDSVGEVVPVQQGVSGIKVIGDCVYIAAGGSNSIIVSTLAGEHLCHYPLNDRNPDKVRIKGWVKSSLFLEVRDHPSNGSCRFTVTRIRDGLTMIDCHAGAHLSDLQVECHVIDDACIAICGELSAVSGVWLVDDIGQHERITSPTLEVHLMRWSVDGQALIVSGRDTMREGERQTQCLGRDGRIYWSRPTGACDAAWRSGLDYVLVSSAQGAESRWTVTHGSLSGLELPAIQPPESIGDSNSTTSSLQSSIVILNPKKGACFGVLYVMGPHRSFAHGPERLFYHYAIRSQLESLCHERGLLIGINGNGTRHGGGSKEDSLVTFDDKGASDIATGIEHLRAHCSGPLLIVAASLGSLPTIKFLSKNSVDGAIFINPVYTADIPPLTPWRCFYGTSSSLTYSLSLHAPKIRTPLMLVHGQRDPISPSQHSSEFVMSLREELRCDYVSVPNEGHIFQTSDGWQILLTSLKDFIESIATRPPDPLQIEVLGA